MENNSIGPMFKWNSRKERKFNTIKNTAFNKKMNPYNHILSENSFQLFIDGKQIFKPKDIGKKYEYQEFFWDINEDTAEKEPIIREINYMELTKKGFKIFRLQSTGRNIRSKSKYTYALCRTDEEFKNCMEYISKPVNHILQYDYANNRAMIAGATIPNPAWVSSEDPKKEEIDISNPIEAERIMLGITTKKTKRKLILLQDIPVLITEDGRLVCIPKSNDEAVIGIVGQKGKGKTLLSHQIIDYVYNSWKRNFIILNDINNETTTWYKKNDFRLKYLEHINAQPMGLPLIYLYPNTHELKEDSIFSHYTMGFRFTFPFREFMLNYQLYAYKSEKWELPQKTSNLFDTMAQELAECKDELEIRQVLERYNTKENEMMIDTIQKRINSLLALNILDINTGVPSQWGLKHLRPLPGLTGNYNPFIATIISKGIPVLMTSEIRRHGFFPQYFYYIVREIYDKYKNDSRFKPPHINPVWMFCDEITELAPRDEKKQGIVFEMLKTLVTEGRMNRVGFIWATQNPEEIAKRIYRNTMYTFIFYMDNTQAKEIGNVYNFDDTHIKRITSLKKMQVLARTSEYFHIYEKNSDKPKIHTVNDGPIVGELLTPLSMHKAPGGK